MEITEIITPFSRALDRPARGSGDERGDSCSVTFRTNYGDDLFAFLGEIAGKVVLIGDPPTAEVKVPLRFPDTTLVDLYAERYTWQGVGGRKAIERANPNPAVPAGSILAPGPIGTGWNATHVHAEITVDFKLPEFNYQDSVLVSRRNRISARVVTVPGAPFKYAITASGAAPGKPINQDVGIVIPTQEIRLTRHWVSHLEEIEAAVMGLIYTTNNAPMVIGGVEWAAGCVLFGGFDSDQSRGGFGGLLTSRVDYSVLVDSIGWDKVMSDITARFEPVTPFIYQRSDLSVLLTL